MAEGLDYWNAFDKIGGLVRAMFAPLAASGPENLFLERPTALIWGHESSGADLGR